MAGDWVAARRAAQDCEDLVEQGERAWINRALMARARILAFDGDLDRARSIAINAALGQEADDDRWEAAIFRALLGFIELSIPEPRAALGHLRAALDHADAMAIVLPTQFRFLGDLIEAAVLAGELDLAERIVAERLEGPAALIPLPWIQGMAARGRGLLAAAHGRLDEAIAHFDNAVAVFELEMPMPFERARTLLARGQVARRADRRRAAREDIESALTVFDRLGARAWSDRAAHALARIGGRRSAGVALTAAEQQVAALAVAGRSNNEIAAELVVSVRTVESQLSAVYRKLDIRSRSKLRDAMTAADGSVA
jgi:DNA-binding CsgD family transcriptional regulator